ncbi:MAG: MFS transporter [Chryseotalea sp.]|jgi:predicted MFS family arabinose efflux permease
MKSEKILLFTLAAIMFTHIMDFMIMMPLGPQLIRLLEISPQQFSLLVSSYTITAGITGFISAFLIDRFDRKTSLIVMYTGFAFGTLACGFSTTYDMLMITRSIAGAFGGVLGALVMSMVSDAVPLERRAGAIGLVMASFSVASVAGVPIGLFLADKFNWQMPFLSLGGFSVLIWFTSFFTVPNMRKHLIAGEKPKNPLQVLSSIFGNKNARIGLLFSAMLMLGHFTIVPFISPYMVGNVGLSEGELMYIYLVGGACTMFFSPWVGKMADKYGRLTIFTIFGTLVMLPIFAITNLPVLPLWQCLVVAAVFFVFANGRFVPSTTMETAVIAPEIRGSYMSIRSSVQQLASGLAAFVAGIIITEKPSVFSQEAKALVNYNYVGAIAIFFSLLALWVARHLKATTTQ